MRKWLKDRGEMENKDEIFNDSTAPMAFINLRGKLQLESKDDMKDRGVQSPNYADALALTFAQPVKLKTTNSKFSELRRAGKLRRAGAM